MIRSPASESLSPLLKSKYESISCLCHEMTSDEPNDRPICKNILKDENSWALTLEEFEWTSELDKLANNNNKLFVRQLLLKKTSTFAPFASEYSSDTIRKKWFDLYFKIIEKIGNSLFGQVFKVRNELERKTFAIKKLIINDINECEFMKCLDNFWQITQLNDNRLTQYHDLWLEHNISSDNGHYVCHKSLTLYIQMEFYEKSLTNTMVDIENDSNLKRNNLLTPLGYCLTSSIFIEITEGLNYLHNQNILHQNLKPENIFLSIENKKFVKIGESGLKPIYNFVIKSEVGLSDSKKIIGLGDSDEHNFKTDIHSMGIIFQQLFSTENIRFEKHRINFKT
jgi:serine/threonine protein kinase